MKKILATLIIILGFWPFVRESHASISSQPLSLQELSDRSSLIVVGAVSKMESLWNPERTKIFTFIQIEVEDYIKGAERELLTVRIPGGTAEGITEVHPGGPTFVEGEKVLLFLAPGDGYSDSAGLNQGTYSILGDRVLGMGGSSGKFIHHIKALNGKEPLDFETLSELENEESSEPDLLPFDNLPLEDIRPNAASPRPVISKVTPSSASAGTHTVVTIEGSHFGSTPGSVWFRATDPNVQDRIPNLQLQASVVSWTDTQIKCEVPVAVVNNVFYSSGTFDDAIYVNNGSWSSPAPFYVPFGYMGKKWPTNTVSYYINENADDCVGEGAAVQAAAASWNGYSKFSFVYAGSTNATDYGMNGVNEILWVHDDPGLLAMGPCWIDNSTGMIRECDVVFGDASFQWNTAGIMSGTNFDVQAFATHELGHWLALADVYGVKDMTKAMGRVNDRQAPSADDIAGIQYIYDTPPETISTPRIPSGPSSGVTGVSYTYSAGGAVSNLGHPVEYQFDWIGDYSDESDWGPETRTRMWTVPGTYHIQVMAHCANHPSVGSSWSASLTVTISVPISLTGPSDQSHFTACSLYAPPMFSWNAGETFKSSEIQFSLDPDFNKTPIKTKAASSTNIIASSIWKRVLSLPGRSGGTVHWRVAGTRSDKARTKVFSEVWSMTVDPPESVGNPTVSSASRSSIPTLGLQNNCNVKFKIWFGNNLDLPKATKKRTFLFTVKNPLDNAGGFNKTLTLSQWKSIRTLGGDNTGGTIYWYVESWDGLGRYAKTNVMSFALTD
jgi:hypothetical protein